MKAIITSCLDCCVMACFSVFHYTWAYVNPKTHKDMYKTVPVTPLLKKQGLDTDSLGNYCPVSNLHTISKIVERVFMTRLVEHVKRSPNYNRFQSAYRLVLTYLYL